MPSQEIYRVGTIENLLGDFAYVIQKKTWYGWRTLVKYYDKSKWKSAVEELQNNDNVIVLG